MNNIKTISAGNRLKQWRKNAGYSTVQAANHIGVTRQCYWRWEARPWKFPISMNVIHQVSRKTGIKLEELRPDREF